MNLPIDSIFDEELLPERSDRKIFRIAMVVMAAFCVAILVNLLPGVLRFSSLIPLYAKVVLIVIMSIPVVALTLLLFKKKAGWILSTAYLGFVCVILIGSLVLSVSRDHTIDSFSDIKSISLVGSALVSYILLLQIRVRRYLRIGRTALFWSIAVSVAFGLGYLAFQVAALFRGHGLS